MKPSAKRRNKRAHVESEDDVPLASASSVSNLSESSQTEVTNKKKTVKRQSGKKSIQSENESSETESTKKPNVDIRKSSKKSKYISESESEHQDEEASDQSENDEKLIKQTKKGKETQANKEETLKKGKGKRGRKFKAKPKDTKPTNGNVVEDNTDYEVEDIVEQKMKFGKLHYLIRWKGFGPSDDTWERADGLHCTDIIKKYKQRLKAESEAQTSGDDATEEYEVSRILEVHFRRDGTREFLVGWKGFKNKDNTWEHESNMNCPDMMAHFMLRVEQAKAVLPRDLREYRKPTNHYTANSFNVLGRRLSGRSKDKPRVNYFYDDQY